MIINLPKACKHCLPLQLAIVVLLSTIVTCAYFNTFYNAQNYFNQGLKTVTSDTMKSDVEPFDKAIEKCASVIVKYPESRYVDDALFMMGVSYYFKGDYERALEKLEFLTINFPGSKLYDDAMYYTGLAYYKTRKLSKAIIALKEATRFKPFRKRASVMLCYAYYLDGNYRDLTNTAKSLMKMKLTRKEKLMILNILAEAEYVLKEYDSALKTLNEIEKLEQAPAEKKNIKLKIANIYLENGEVERCRNYLEDESDPEFRMLLADLYIRMEDIGAAKQIYREIIETQTSEYGTKAYFELARIAEKEDSLELAIAYYDSLIPRAQGEILSRAKARSEILKKNNRIHK